ncbi:MAG: 2-phospho-L-lactate transferase [Acidimicrobiales bacterium]
MARTPSTALTQPVVALAGGVGAARLLRGIIEVVPPRDVVAVVNTADDVVRHGLHVSPDLDTVTYTLAGAVPPERGWGLEDETWTAMEALARYGEVAPPGSQAGTTWFRLGDRDLATHLYRTARLADGDPLSAITAEVAAAWGVGVRILPMSDDPVRTIMDVVGEGEMGFQEYFVERRHAVPVKKVRFEGAATARPAPGVLDALAAANTVVICPSNPIVSIAPIVAVPGVREAVMARRDRTVAVSPIVAGAALRGPADRLLAELGHEVSVAGVARLYASIAATLVVDEADAGQAAAVEAAGMRCVVAPAVMRGVPEAAALGRIVLGR